MGQICSDKVSQVRFQPRNTALTSTVWKSHASLLEGKPSGHGVRTRAPCLYRYTWYKKVWRNHGRGPAVLHRSKRGARRGEKASRPGTLSLSLILTQILCIHEAIMRFSDAVPK